MIAQLAYRMLKEPAPRLLAKCAWNLGWKGMRAMSAFESRLKRGEFFPAFVFLSVTSRCNLQCQGCWISVNKPGRTLDVATLDRVIVECKRQGSSFFGLLGGEPLMHPGLFELLERHRDCYFQLFTNGTLLTDEVAGKLRQLGNVTPLISIEGSETVSDERRGGKAVYRRSMEGLEACRRHRLITGVATSVCRSNFADLASEKFVHELIGRGVHYVWYYIYRPVGVNPTPELVLSEEQVLQLRQFMVDIRCREPIVVVDAYWDHEGRALCPAVTGISHHIGPGGDIEPCPVIQFSRENVGDGSDLVNKLAHSEFLAKFRTFAAQTTRGCIIMDHPAQLKQFLVEQQAADTTGRGSGLAELAAMQPQTCHHVAGREIPEKHWMYRFAKKRYFFGFGAYG
ncbi:MAG: radical SAM protein [Verrucomicrobiota bacterium]